MYTSTLCILLVLILSIQHSIAQSNDTLPAFSAVSKEGVITISWLNRFTQNLSQVNIQRSKDSAKGFVTIHSLPNPDLRNVSYVDKTAKNDSSYYRIFILFEGANYIFTPSKRPFRDTTKPVKPAPIIVVKKDSTVKKPVSNEVKKEVAAPANTVSTPATTAPKIEQEKPPPPPHK